MAGLNYPTSRFERSGNPLPFGRVAIGHFVESPAGGHGRSAAGAGRAEGPGWGSLYLLSRCNSKGGARAGSGMPRNAKGAPAINRNPLKSLVGHERLELSTNGLRVRCSTN